MPRIITVLFIFTLFFFNSQKLLAEIKVVAGPVICHLDEHSANVWLMVKGQGEVKMSLVNQSISEKSLSQHTDNLIAGGKWYPVVFNFLDLKPNTKYSILITAKGWAQERDYSLQTPDFNTISDFKFITGSCAMLPPKSLNPGFPGPKDKIFPVLQSRSADFMLWLGDNLYYPPNQWYNPIKMYIRNLRRRKRPNLNEFLMSSPQIAIWDDHDFGPDNAVGDYIFKDTTLFVFKQLWANKSFGEKNNKGIYSKFSWYDLDLFLLDNRYHASQPNTPDATLLGANQFEWLRKELLNSKSSFKLIVSGIQVLNKNTPSES